jgi:hypothetical protein
MTETELRIADLELRIGDIGLVFCAWANEELDLTDGDLRGLLARKARLTEELRCLKQSVPQQRSE